MVRSLDKLKLLENIRFLVGLHNSSMTMIRIVYFVKFNEKISLLRIYYNWNCNILSFN